MLFNSPRVATRLLRPLLLLLLLFHLPPRLFERDLEYDGLNNQSFKFFIHAKGQGRKEKPPTLVFSPARNEEEGEKYSAGFGGRFHNTVTEKDPSTPPDASRFHLIRKVQLSRLLR